jgi:hypothetical protein
MFTDAPQLRGIPEPEPEAIVPDHENNELTSLPWIGLHYRVQQDG